MKARLKIASVSLLGALCLLAFASCGKEASGEDVNISLNESMIEMTVGESYELKATVSPDDVADKNIVWTSSDEGVAGVAKGVITAKTAGETVVKAETNGKEVSCRVTVKETEGETPDES